ncbi:cell division protein ZapA [Bombella favorum]|uniref:Cell division protein ZapA n=1 Tax=Bombella favorum TaxID=2039164 RepID=A0ABR5ZQ02_9PROT|nr:cell division protein ZapA [Bombella favorum]MBA5726374.1 hypothetical protein [Bombella favorum]
MAQVTLSVGGLSYTVGCQDGEEEYLKDLAASISRRLEEVRRTLGPRGDGEAMFLVALLTTDDLYEARKKQMTDEERAAVARSSQIEASYKQTAGRLADAADIATSLLRRVEEGLKPSAGTATANEVAVSE